ncbi:PREDICTED: protein RMD5 homolog A-like [Ipomoea nil]|uniref:protein RMD5 homolog A-like n=1 Tax=Ipomoea nil TaxID=35883 RepID=UPI0009016103|nr:PREDICTED: protein RMD5 homolog A-like [Ipomoea nil]XP_019195321.1 PREDICTED: protein RMD5 homolog A-like [Ipomoea nil]XP_019195322.1 PREDICTED: protein RMD5 homolog A-like [Ipomoea nil]XP_019195323.1 PREDICTED: protein RMD5 homolog A-like [Ipomoea nil]XP_019195324.1 PREDICTED: protein RMD5 homolog A-like [Ipomoea nil]XP_019195325.1 PREDICTED: protein RMD5 homolog A-like [Ipomoea nil]XP_019195326.1 PREDICTED: protein RMD5 homolog A-like [Ipomoea nil]XP_019195327.1 PREDICTED: protein RMD5 
MEMELNSIKDAFDRVTNNKRLSASKSQEIIEQVGLEIEQALIRLQSVNDASPTNHRVVLTELKAKLKDIAPLTHLESTQKELNIALSKYLKILEKSFIPDISKAYRNVDGDIHTVNQIIASHFYRDGLFDIGDCFIDESMEPEAAASKSPFLEIYRILEAMRSRNLQPALSWAAANHEKLEQSGSDIEMKLHRQHFVEILQNRGRDEALDYARTVFPPFGAKYMSEVQKLMACLLWAGKLDSSPYSDLLSPVHWDKLAEELTREFCNLIGQSYESPLSVTIAAGVQGLPTLLKLANLMTMKRQEWQSMKQLPVPVDLDREFQFHSIFVCPVSRDQATDDNPPMLLSCGHVLCKQSIAKLSKNNSARPFKCPYCPSEIEAGQCRQLYI